MNLESFYRWSGQDLILRCHLQPKASRDEFCGLHGDRLKIRITAPPADGKANAHLIRFLAKAFGVPRSGVTIINGELGRQKTLCIEQPTAIPTGLELTAANGC